MAKRGYECLCGQFNLRRGKLTRKQYAKKKRVHAEGVKGTMFPHVVSIPGCAILAAELAQSCKAEIHR